VRALLEAIAGEGGQGLRKSQALTPDQPGVAFIIHLDTCRRERYACLMAIVALTVPDDLCAALHVSVERLASEIAFAAAVRLYEEGRVSLAKAADVAGMDRFGFAARLAENGIPTATFEPSDVEAAKGKAGCWQTRCCSSMTGKHAG
jgi:predicted HTH domain antitoxin